MKLLFVSSLLCLRRIQLSSCSYDDYDYGSVNVLLERSLKVFVKTVACHPEQTTARIYHAFWRRFRHSEKVRTPDTIKESDDILTHLFGTFLNEAWPLSF